jgi:hypothetical protein
MSVVDDSYGEPLRFEEEASAPFAGGILNHGFQCGMLWGAALAAGAQAYRLHGPGPVGETMALKASERLRDSFPTKNNYMNCIDITALDMKETSGVFKFLAKGGPIGCFRLAARYAPIARSEIDNALANGEIDITDRPVSCAAELARKMGASEMQATMAAGFAGGVGLSGGACGALGAAIWITIMNRNEEGGGTADYMSPEAMEVIDRFVEASEYEFECSEITGRQFANISEHADYICGGGCSEIIEALATT